MLVFRPIMGPISADMSAVTVRSQHNKPPNKGVLKRSRVPLFLRAHATRLQMRIL